MQKIAKYKNRWKWKNIFQTKFIFTKVQAEGTGENDWESLYRLYVITEKYLIVKVEKVDLKYILRCTNFIRSLQCHLGVTKFLWGLVKN